MSVTGKPFDQMTVAELHRERAYWHAMIEGATSWGASLKAASDCRDGCDAWIARREREAQGAVAKAEGR